MRNWVKRILGREGIEESYATKRELDNLEQRTTLLEKRVQHLRRERAIYENRRRGIAE